ncbi:MAG: DoxX family membrane protein [Halobacteriales archaeon]
MATRTANPFSEAFSFEFSGPLAGYWLVMLRVITGWWFLHAGLSKLLESGLTYSYAPIYLKGMTGTALGGIPVWMGTNMGPFLQAWVPLGEFLIGLGLVVGALVRLASIFGAMFMVLFWVGNAEFAHGLVNGDLMGLLLFVTMIVFATGRYYGLDAIIERWSVVERYPRLRYLLG